MTIITSMPVQSNKPLQYVLAIVGAALGGFVGYLGFFWMRDQGFYALALPGGLLALGAGIGRTKSIAIPIACAIAAFFLSCYTEWQHAPFIADNSFAYLLTHLHQLKPVTMLMIAVACALGFYVPFRRIDNN